MLRVPVFITRPAKSRNLSQGIFFKFTSSSWSIILWTHADDAMKPLNYISVIGLENLKFNKIMPMSSNNWFMLWVDEDVGIGNRKRCQSRTGLTVGATLTVLSSLATFLPHP